MRFATVEYQGKTFVGMVDKAGEKVTPVSVGDINDVFRGMRAEPKGQAIALSSVKLKAPIPLPVRNIMCVGKNYREHAREFTASGFDSSASGAADAIPTAPIIFTKVPQSVIGPDEAIEYPTGASDQLDYEAELAVIIGKTGSQIPRAQARDYIAGYAIGLDMTVRGPELPSFRKSIDSYAVLGPWLVTKDEIADPNALDFELKVNGETRQKSNTRYLDFNVDRLIEYASSFYTLYPGDIIMTGTPAGVAPVKPGDVMTVDMQGIGRMEVKVRAA